MTNAAMTYDELYALGEVDSIIEKAMLTCQKKIAGKTFIGMELEDVVQEAATKVYRSLSTFDPDKARLSTYVDHVIEMQIRDCLRRAGAIKSIKQHNAVEYAESYESADFYERDVKEAQGITLGRVDYRLEFSEVITDLMHNMGLTDREKQVFNLRAAGYEFIEIAKYLGVTKARISQMWKAIKTKYEQLG